MRRHRLNVRDMPAYPPPGLAEELAADWLPALRRLPPPKRMDLLEVLDEQLCRDFGAERAAALMRALEAHVASALAADEEALEHQRQP